MIAELGHFALILALGLALLLSVVPAVGVMRHHVLAMRLAPALTLGYCCMVWIAYIALTEAFINHDFSIAYVAAHSNTQLPLGFRISAVWGGHEGSLLLWLGLLASWTAAVSVLSRNWPLARRARVLSVLAFIGLGFLLFILLTSNPFARLTPFFPSEGRDLNPLLQDFALIIHPPTLYMGYVGFAVAFSLAIAALWEGKPDSAWAKSALPWTLWAWVFLTLGIMLGSWWAYYELGWGGWWFWDPVENASLMPWLVGTALIHSLLVTAKRGYFTSWTLLLAILAFSLSLLGTFLVRSGVLTSVHAFANDPERGLFILGFLGVVVGCALGLYAWRAKSLTAALSHVVSKTSREALLLANNIILVIACCIILLGTLYPLLLDAFNLGQVSVGAPYFNTLFVPLFSFLVFLMGFAPRSRWGQGLQEYAPYLLLGSILFGVSLWFFSFQATPSVIIGVIVSVWLIATTIEELCRRWYRLPLRKWHTVSRSFYGMLVAHLGVAVTTLGITISSAYSIERDVRITAGESVALGAYTFHFIKTQNIKGPNYQSVQGEFFVDHQGKRIAQLYPERRINNAQQMLTTKTAIDPGLLRDLYVALGEPLPNQSWAVRVYYKPFIRWIWLGAILMALGGIVAATKREQ